MQLANREIVPLDAFRDGCVPDYSPVTLDLLNQDVMDLL